MTRELPKVYEPQQVENRIYKMWEENGHFKPNKGYDAKPFTIVMPPSQCYRSTAHGSCNGRNVAGYIDPL